MFADEPDQYLISFKNFLLAQRSGKEDPAAAALIAEIDRELLRRAEASPRGVQTREEPL